MLLTIYIQDLNSYLSYIRTQALHTELKLTYPIHTDYIQDYIRNTYRLPKIYIWNTSTSVIYKIHSIYTQYLMLHTVYIQCIYEITHGLHINYIQNTYTTYELHKDYIHKY
jgi:hypothetical protein